MQRNYPLVLKIGMSNRDVWSWAEGEQSREQVGEWLWSNPVIKPEASKLTTAKVDFGAASEIRYQSPFSSQKFSPKNFHLPFKHMYEALNIIK